MLLGVFHGGFASKMSGVHRLTTRLESLIVVVSLSRLLSVKHLRGQIEMLIWKQPPRGCQSFPLFRSRSIFVASPLNFSIFFSFIVTHGRLPVFSNVKKYRPRYSSRYFFLTISQDIFRILIMASCIINLILKLNIVLFKINSRRNVMNYNYFLFLVDFIIA